ncbi:periplasmic heavy metal sensor [bacterium]|nr:periplasmic heavy metal sensor [bacterium]
MITSRTSLLLIASLALNAALVGIVGGRFVSKGPPIEQRYVERYRPTSETVLSAWAQLPDSDRQRLRQELRDAWNGAESERELLHLAGREVADAARAEPFDEARLRNALFIFQRREALLQQRAEDILISHMSGMPPEARAIAAGGLLTPFNSRVRGSNPRPDDQAEGAATSVPADGGGRPFQGSRIEQAESDPARPVQQR